VVVCSVNILCDECDYDKKEECQCEEEWDYQMYSKKEYDRLCAKEAVHRK
jgi:hypothetical protein